MAAETFGQALRRLRGELSLREVARLANVGKSHVHNLEKGMSVPSKAVAAALDTALNANGELIATFGKIEAREKIVRFCGSNPTISVMCASDGNVVHDNDEAEEDATNRRRLLQMAAGAGFGALGIRQESVRQMLDLTMGVRRTVEDWHVAVEDHLWALQHRPPGQVSADLGIDLQSLSQDVAASPDANLTELYRVAAMLSCWQANALTRMGDHGTAIRWWHTARQAADTSQDLELRLFIQAEEAGHGLYGQRSPETVLRLIENGRHITTKRPRLKLLTAEAKALAMLGRHSDARRILHMALDLSEKQVGDPTPGAWSEDHLRFAESWVYAASGQEAPAAAARERVIELTNDYQYLANVELHTALCVVVRGGVDEGIRHAATVIGSLPEGYRSAHIRETARMVLRGVPFSQRTRTSVGDLRALLAS